MEQADNFEYYRKEIVPDPKGRHRSLRLTITEDNFNYALVLTAKDSQARIFDMLVKDSRDMAKRANLSIYKKDIICVLLFFKNTKDLEDFSTCFSYLAGSLSSNFDWYEISQTVRRDFIATFDPFGEFQFFADMHKMSLDSIQSRLQELYFFNRNIYKTRNLSNIFK